MTDKTNMAWVIGGIGLAGLVGWAMLRKPKRGTSPGFEADEGCADFEFDAGEFITTHDQMMNQLTREYIAELKVMDEQGDFHLEENPDPIEIANRYLKLVAPQCPTPPPPDHSSQEFYMGVLYSAITWLNVALQCDEYPKEYWPQSSEYYFEQLGYE